VQCLISIFGKIEEIKMDYLEKQQKADNLRNSGKTKEAIKLYQELFEYYDQQKLHDKAGGALQMVGVSHKIDNSTEESLKFLNKAADYFRLYNDMVGLGSTLRDIGITYEYIDNLVEAEKYLDESAKILKDTDDKNGYAITLAKIGHVLTRQEKYNEAKESLENAITILEESGHWFFLATSYGHLANLFICQSDYEQAIKIIYKALDIYDKEKQEKIHTRRYSQAWGLLAFCYANLGELEKAKSFLQKSLNIVLSADFSVSATAVVLRDIRAKETLEILARQ